MKKEKLITRTIKRAICDVVFVDLETNTVENKVVSCKLCKTLDDYKKAIANIYESDILKVVAVTGFTITEQLYGITEEDFLLHGRIINK